MNHKLITEITTYLDDKLESDELLVPNPCESKSIWSLQKYTSWLSNGQAVLVANLLINIKHTRKIPLQ